MPDPLRFTEVLTARCDRKLANAVIKIANRDHSRPSDVIRRAVALYLKREGFDLNDMT
jgi:predicted transcriptional regulator